MSMMSLDEALAHLLAFVSPLPDIETVSLLEADGRIMAKDLVSPLQVPSHDISAMDGYALRCSDVYANEIALPVSQRIPAGAMPVSLAPGTVARIFTGAPLPEAADAVVMQEQCTVSGVDALQRPLIKANLVPVPGQWIRRSGEDILRGSVVLERGSRVGVAALGLAASVGCAELSVVRRPRVALLATGNELVMPGTVAPEALPAGHIFNSNRFFLQRLLKRLGCEVTDLGQIPDTLDATKLALTGAAQGHDLILTTGGVSVGEEDHIKPAVQSLGSLDLWQVAIKPGKPFAHGRIGASHVIGLPGNPVSSFVTFILLVRPFLLRMQGVQEVALPAFEVRADFDRPQSDRRREFVRVRRNLQGGLDLFPNQSSGVLTSMAWADGLVDVAPGQAIAYGDKVRFIALADVLT